MDRLRRSFTSSSSNNNNNNSNNHSGNESNQQQSSSKENNNNAEEKEEDENNAESKKRNKENNNNHSTETNNNSSSNNNQSSPTARIQSSGQLLLGSPSKPIKYQCKSTEGSWNLSTSYAFLGASNSKGSKERRINPISPCRLCFTLPKALQLSSKLKSNSNTNHTASSSSNEDDSKSSNPSPSLYFAITSFDSLYIAIHGKEQQNSSSKELYYEKSLKFHHIPTAVDCNHHYNNSLRIVLGFRSGELYYTDPGIPSGSTSSIAFEKDKFGNPGPVTCVSWIPNSETCFLASFTSGSCFLFDIQNNSSFPIPSSSSSSEGINVTVLPHEKGGPICKFDISKSLIHSFKFSPDGKRLALVNQDGLLYIFKWERRENEKIEVEMIFVSNYGGFLCVNWSSDNKYVITGGEDDFVCVWSITEAKCVARGKGHRANPGVVTFDPWQCNNTKYRIASAGQDTRVLFWDFVEGETRKPKSQKGGKSSWIKSSSDSENKDNGKSKKRIETDFFQVPMLEPILSHRAHNEPISDLIFLEDGMASLCWAGIYRFWKRPK
eukprot:TRINITY_DN8468_c1_g1_i1.p1 TRINITY_DN8468_c1_g1~~TRINITY_DN8468_c1_g1_i1.p1  ORF type:complete len:550 (+),score=139.61 TRINITY_DN8468_c1_g1_i1:65-1714(+)